jgi:exopolyphosphatase / guanosine-5'-triphosphate,3'-diphosphate pyrophosphatase
VPGRFSRRGCFRAAEPAPTPDQQEPERLALGLFQPALAFRGGLVVTRRGPPGALPGLLRGFRALLAFVRRASVLLGGPRVLAGPLLLGLGLAREVTRSRRSCVRLLAVPRRLLAEAFALSSPGLHLAPEREGGNRDEDHGGDDHDDDGEGRHAKPLPAPLNLEPVLPRAAGAAIAHPGGLRTSLVILRMLCAAIDIGSNTTRLLVAEPDDGQLRKVMEQRAYTRIGKATTHGGAIDDDKVEEVAAVVATQVRLAEELGAEAIKIVATAAIREAANRDAIVELIAARCDREVEVLSEHDEGRLSFIGATKTLGHPVAGEVGVVDVGGGSTEIVFGSIAAGVSAVHSFKIGSGALADELVANDPPSAAEIRAIRDNIADFFDGVELERPDQAVAVGGSATSLRTLVGAVLEYETLERAIRVLVNDPVGEVAKRFELDPRRVRILPTGVLLLEKLSELLGRPLQIGKGGLREGVILDLLNGSANGQPARLAA